VTKKLKYTPDSCFHWTRTKCSLGPCFLALGLFIGVQLVTFNDDASSSLFSLARNAENLNQ
jgi:hypothetical protein